MNELVSIVIPVYNAEKYLQKALESCINQTYSRIEIITVNDGSKDSSIEILNSYADKINVITQENKGISGAINTGIRGMKGNLYKLMNADDLLYPNCVETLVSEYDKINSEKAIIYGNYDTIDTNGNIIDEVTGTNRNDESNFEQGVALLDFEFPNSITTLFHKNTFLKFGFYSESVRFAEDYELFLRLIIHNQFRFHLVEKKIAMYRKHFEQDTRILLDEAPDYNKFLRNSVLTQLNPELRLKYKNSLKEFKKANKKNIPISWKMKKGIKKLMFKYLPESNVKNILKTYRKTKYKMK